MAQMCLAPSEGKVMKARENSITWHGISCHARSSEVYIMAFETKEATAIQEGNTNSAMKLSNQI